MIRSIRKILHLLLGNQLVDDQTLLTFIAEMEKILNDCPLIPPSSDPRDPEPLAPSKLLLLCPNMCCHPDKMHGVNNQYRGKRWRQAQYLADIFWKRWFREYLHVPTLQVRKKWLKKRPKLAVGDYVLLVDENCPRGRWPKGVIQEVFPDRHRVDRHVTVKTATMSLRRDIRKLCLLERSLMSKE
ncbi:uncharacterized protein [Montipora capricornis]|uniref:uncharacterized protein n=1 Tax=Montipora capricornis TaxID=246305 RepID=UPI0035F2054A